MRSAHWVISLSAEITRRLRDCRIGRSLGVVLDVEGLVVVWGGHYVAKYPYPSLMLSRSCSLRSRAARATATLPESVRVENSEDYPRGLLCFPRRGTCSGSMGTSRAMGCLWLVMMISSLVSLVYCLARCFFGNPFRFAFRQA